MELTIREVREIFRTITAAVTEQRAATQEITRSAVVPDPLASFRQRQLMQCKNSFALMLGVPGRLPSLAGQEHGRTTPLADIEIASTQLRHRLAARTPW
jgi:hypothetical protein